MANEKIFFKSLDTLRFFAFFMVFCQHAFWPAFNFNDPHSLSQKAIMLLCNGSLGVSFFFVLSGFLITYLILQEKNKTGTIHVGFFYMRRALRIWPLYYALILTTLFIYPYLRTWLGLVDLMLDYNKFMHFIFLSNIDVIRVLNTIPKNNSTLVDITWSVSVEEQFYLLWPLLFRFIPSKGYKFIFPVIILASFIFRYLNKDDYNTVYFHTFSVISDLAVGGFAAYLAIYNKHFFSFITKIKTIHIVIIYFLGLCFLLHEHLLIKDKLWLVSIRIFHSLFFVFIILEQNFSDHSFKKFGDWKVLARLGTITYGLYLLHPVCLQIVEFAWPYFPFKMKLAYEFIIKGVIGFSISVALCKISYRYYESYFLKLKDRFAFIKTK